MTRAHATTNHERIREWIESRGGHPATVAVTGEQGLLRIDFDPSEESLEEVDWDTFFDTFEHKQLAFLYQDETADGKPSRFNKFIDRTSTEASDLSEDDNAEELEASASGSKASKPSKASTKSSSKNKAGGSKTKSSAEDEAEDEYEADEELDDEDFDDEDEDDEDEK